jgi:AcrR family transcriptional regulator
MMQVLKESVRNAIVEGAITEFFQYGFQKANMRRIADNANITVGNIYRYYKNKEELFNEILLPAERAIDDLESFDRKLHVTRIDSEEDVNQLVQYVINVLKPYTREVFIMIYNSEGTHYQKVKAQLEKLVVDKINSFYPRQFDRYLLTVLAQSFVQAVFHVFKENVNNIRKIQEYISQLVVYFFRDMDKRMF